MKNQPPKKFKNLRLYILYYIFSKGGTANLYQLDGRQFEGNYQKRISILHELSVDGYITHIPRAFNMTYSLTDKGKQEYFELTAFNCLEVLNSNQYTFQFIHNILPEIGITDFEPDFAEMIAEHLIGKQQVYATEEGKLMINENGQTYLDAQRGTGLSRMVKIIKSIYKNDWVNTWVVLSLVQSQQDMDQIFNYTFTN